jgi:hypothetical protein
MHMSDGGRMYAFSWDLELTQETSVSCTFRVAVVQVCTLYIVGKHARGPRLLLRIRSVTICRG